MNKIDDHLGACERTYEDYLNTSPWRIVRRRRLKLRWLHLTASLHQAIRAEAHPNCGSSACCGECK